MSTGTQYSVRAVARVLDLLDFLRERPAGATLTELAAAMEMPKSSMFRYLATLESRGYVEREGTSGVFRLGAAFLVNESQHLARLARTARPRLEALRDEFDETVNLGVLDGARVVYLEIVESRRSMRFVARKGDREHMHSTALGKAIAMTLPDEEIRAILEAEGMPPRTDRTITDPDEFIAAIQAARSAGYAIDDGENEAAGRCVAVPIPGSAPRAAISLSAPAARFSGEDARRAAGVLNQLVDDLSGELS